MDYTRDETAAMYALPTPADTPYRTPMASRSRNVTPSPEPQSAPPTTSTEQAPSRTRSGTHEMVTTENISPLDPRRFTPTLHASLVGEILSLRRELENRSKDISHLEEVLHSTKSENQDLAANVSTYNQDNRNLRKQMELLEGGTLSALDDIAKERDEALENLSDVRRKLEQSQRRARSQQDETERTNLLFQSEKSTWDADRRALETKVHIVEGRLKVVLGEVAASQQANEPVQSPSRNAGRSSVAEGSVRSESVASVRPKNGTGRRRASTASSHGPRDLHSHYRQYSVDDSPRKPGGPSLADELAFSDDEEYLDEEDEDDESPGAHPEERSPSVQSRPQDLKARKLLGLSTDAVNILDRAELEQLSLLEEENDETLALKADYIDAATQCSPPPTPTSLTRKDKLETVKEESLILPADVVANSGRKRVPGLDRVSVEDLRASTLRSASMTSSSAQTGELPSPPTTPKLVDVNEVKPQEPQNPVSEKLQVSRETQTDIAEVSNYNSGSLPILPIPKIAIHPPSSRPATPRDGVVLPPHTKNAACQVVLSELTDLRSIGTQTGEIRIDSRPVKLPPQLLPAAIPRPKSPEVPRAVKPKPPRMFKSPPPVAQNISGNKAAEKQPLVPRNPPSNDTGRLTKDLKQDIRRPERSSSLFAGFDEADDEDKPVSPIESWDGDDIFDRPTISYTLRGGRMVKTSGSSIATDLPLESDEVDFTDEKPLVKSEQDTPRFDTTGGIAEEEEFDDDKEEFVLPVRAPNHRPRPLRLASNSIRRTALISSGTAAHVGRSRSPSLPSSEAPPFPVPTRHSSRRIPISSSEGARSPTPNGTSFSGDDERNLRKSRSFVGLSHQDRPGSETPPLLSSSTIPESPTLPPMPNDQISPYVPYQTFRNGDSHQWSNQDRQASVAETASTAVAQVTVVDAIAQTMVGEWMWKYVRRGKGFGASEAPHPDWNMSKPGDEVAQSLSNSGVRHRRWVWLAPYERAVMWSSKQPTSGPALLGKGSRKLSIQSVLDVKDENTISKSAGQYFNRSILILTPQRALKFTAFNQERHYVWLSALSFLSHSPNDIGDLGSIPPSIPYGEAAPPPVPSRSSRRPAIRDSIRVAKGRTGPGPRSFTTDGNIPRLMEAEPQDNANDCNYPNFDDAADAPTVPRTSTYSSMHSRKRSNTAPRPGPPTSFRTYPSISAYTSSLHSGSAGSSSIEHQSHPFPSTTNQGGPSSSNNGAHPSMTNTARSSTSRRTSHSSAGPQAQAMNSYFDNLGTVRMEAFISPTLPEHHTRGHGANKSSTSTAGNSSNAGSQSKSATPNIPYINNKNTRPRGKKDMSYWGAPSVAPSLDFKSPVSDGGHGVPNGRDLRDTWGVLRGERGVGGGDDPFRGF